MELTFLGTAASEGYPDAFCGCANCEDARRLGGANLRKRSAALLDGEMLLDLGPDIMAASLMHGVSLARVRTCLLTHEHDDHLDPSHFWSRSPRCGVVGAPCLEFYASRPALSQVAEKLKSPLAGGGLLDSGTSACLNLRLCPIEPGETLAVGPYRVIAVPTTHAPDVVALLYLIERGGRALFYATDTGPLPDNAWQVLRQWGGRINALVLDHTFGTKQRSTGHLNADQFLEEVEQLRGAGLLADDCRILAHHLAHHSNPDHDTLAAFAAKRGYDVAYDGLSLMI